MKSVLHMNDSSVIFASRDQNYCEDTKLELSVLGCNLVALVGGHVENVVQRLGSSSVGCP